MLTLSKQRLVELLWATVPNVRQILMNARSLTRARSRLFHYLDDLERAYFNVFSRQARRGMHISERHIAKECIRVLKNYIRTENETLCDASLLRTLQALAQMPQRALRSVSEGFLCECVALFQGALGEAHVLARDGFTLSLPDTRQAARVRSRELDRYAVLAQTAMARFASGLDPARRAAQRRNARHIQHLLGARDRDWQSWRWHLAHGIKDAATLARLVQLEDDERAGLAAAAAHGIPFQITPYYLTLFNRRGRVAWDRAVRAQVIPSVRYCTSVAANRSGCLDMDFMCEKTTSPVEAVTRRYPQIVILKPLDACPQICVYCQRNWEIKPLDAAPTGRRHVQRALQWLRQQPEITEVLLTGGDPLTLTNDYLGWLLGALAAMPHIARIRIGTRTLVTMPQRVDRGLLALLARVHQPGRRVVCLVTHVQSARELTPQVLDAVSAVRRLGISVYNQQVYTYYGSRRFELCHLRILLKQCGIDPYYTFNTKGKEETVDFRVPMARIEQERREEARLLPGLVRLDTPVFNVPRIGKSNLRAWQDHEPIMLLPDGRRVYRFYPWESALRVVDDYLYTDVGIYEYLLRLRADGEQAEDYASIWYFF